MQCLYPVLVKGKDRGNIIPCGKCRPCLINEVNDWSTRLKIEHEHSFNSAFITLTYETDPTELKREDLRHFLKRLRNYYQYRVKHSTDDQKSLIRWFAVGEYGNLNLRPHYHILLFNIPIDIKKDYKIELLDIISKLWEKGIVHMGEVNQKTINYCSKYIFKQKKINFNEREKPFRLMSKGIGRDYSVIMKDYHIRTLNNFITKDNGIKKRLPKYLKYKLFDDDNRKKLRDDLEIKLNENHLKKYVGIKHEKLREELINEKINNLIFNNKLNEQQTI